MRQCRKASAINYATVPWEAQHSIFAFPDVSATQSALEAQINAPVWARYDLDEAEIALAEAA